MFHSVGSGIHVDSKLSMVASGNESTFKMQTIISNRGIIMINVICS
jgi:hypothetical protein